MKWVRNNLADADQVQNSLSTYQLVWIDHPELELFDAPQSDPRVSKVLRLHPEGCCTGGLGGHPWELMGIRDWKVQSRTGDSTSSCGDSTVGTTLRAAITSQQALMQRTMNLSFTLLFDQFYE